MRRNKVHQFLFLSGIVGCTAVCIVTASCSDKEGRAMYDPNVPVTVTNFYPDSGGVATQIILNGSNFGTDLNNIQVFFNQKKAAVIGSLGDKLYVITPRRPGDGMPDDGDPERDQVEITVQVGEQRATYDKKFNYRIQTLVSTLCGRPGTTANKVGTLGETEFKHEVGFLAVDAEDNIFVATREWNGENKLILIDKSENQSSIIIDNAGTSAINQPCVIDQGKGLAMPTDEGNTYWTIHSANFWQPKRRDYMAVNAEDADKVKTQYKHSFAYCELDGYFYCRRKNATNFFLKIDANTGNAWVVDTGDNDLKGESDCYMSFSKKDPKKLYMVLTNLHCIAIFEDITNPTREGNFKIYAGMQGRPGHADGFVNDAQLISPRQLVVDDEENLYVADSGNNCIRKITPEGVVSTVIGIPGKSGYKDGTPDVALFADPWGLAIDSEGIIYVGDKNNLCVRQLSIE